MKKQILIAVLCFASVGLTMGAKPSAVKASKLTPATPACNIIKTPVPVRPVGQTDMLEFAAPAIPTVRIAFIGLGMRGPGAVDRMMNIPGVEVVALCDVLEKNVDKVSKMVTKAGRAEPLKFSGDTAIWRKVTALPNVDLIYIATDWASHALIGVQAMKDGKHVAIEVPASMSLQESWDLINTSEATRKHCMQLENCVYDFFEMTALNMAQKGLFGEVLHAEGAYIHGLQPFWNSYWNSWRMDWNRKHRGDVYPTHGLGPVCQVLDIHRGDKMEYLVAMDTKAVGNPEFIKQNTGETVTDFKNGDHTMTMIRTANGKSILIEHNITSPRPYSRMFQLTGTRGFAEKYPTEAFALSAAELPSDVTVNHEKLNAHSYVPDSLRDALMAKYMHPIQREIGEMAKTVGGHGGMDFIMDYRLIYCLQNGLPLDMDVYDLAEWCAPIELSAISLENNSAPVAIPDFTRGGQDRIKGFKFHYTPADAPKMQ